MLTNNTTHCIVSQSKLNGGLGNSILVNLRKDLALTSLSSSCKKQGHISEILTLWYSIVSPLSFDISTINRDGATLNTCSPRRESWLDTPKGQKEQRNWLNNKLYKPLACGGWGRPVVKGAQTGILCLLPLRNPEKNKTHLCGDWQLSLSTLFTAS